MSEAIPLNLGKGCNSVAMLLTGYIVEIQL